VNEPLAAGIIRRLTADTARSALPDAPIRIEPASRRQRQRAPGLRRRSALLLVGLAGRLDPGTRAGRLTAT
jgi:hypothetical protein